MDYRSLLQQFNKIDSEISVFIAERTNRNISRGDDIVKDYVTALRNNEYSIKSFKAKIIHNELEHRRTTEDFNKLISEAYIKIDDVLEKCFNNYIDELSKPKVAFNKSNDMREYEIAKRRNRQDVLNRINSLTKEFYQEEAADNEKFENRIEEQEELLNIEKRKLQIDLKKCDDDTIKKYNTDEAALLVNDDLETINKLKESIKSVRFEGLKEILKLKLSHHSDIKEKKIGFLNEKRDYLLNKNKKYYDLKVKTAEYQLQIREIELQIERRGFDYDFEFKKNRYEKLRNDKYTFVSLSKIHNEYLYKFEKDSIDENKEYKFIIAFILIKFYQMLITICEKNIFDPLIGLLEDFININKHNNENYSNTIKNIKLKLSDGIESLRDALSDVSLKQKTEKRMTKENLVENVITSIERYYNNIALEVAMFNDELEKVFLHIICKFNEMYKNTVNSELLSHNECLFLNTNYDRSDFSSLGYQKYDFSKEENISLDDYYLDVRANLDQFTATIEEDYQNEIRVISKNVLAFETKMKQKIDEARDNFNKIVSDNKRELEKNNNKEIKLIEKQIKNCEKEFILLCKKDEKVHKKQIGVL